MSVTYITGSNIPATDMTPMSAVTSNGSTNVHAGDLVTITMGTLDPVNVLGSPTLQLSDNETAIYSGGTGTSTLTFTYVVRAGDNTTDLKITGINLPEGANITYTDGVVPLPTIQAPWGPITGSIIFRSTDHLTEVKTHDLGIHVDTTITPPTSVQQEIMGLYAALYGRAGESSGLSYWVGLVGQQAAAGGVNVASAGTAPITMADATMLGQNFVTSQIDFFNANYGGLNDSQFINALYVNIGGTAGDPNGVAYWSNLLGNAELHGQTALAARAGLAGQFVDALIAFDTNTRLTGLSDQQWSDAVTRQGTINNKVAVSIAYANASAQVGGEILIPHSVIDPAYHAAISLLQGVTADPNTVAVAVAGINNAVAHHDLSLI